jgi:hypothetical protein
MLHFKIVRNILAYPVLSNTLFYAYSYCSNGQRALLSLPLGTFINAAPARNHFSTSDYKKAKKPKTLIAFSKKYQLRSFLSIIFQKNSLFLHIGRKTLGWDPLKK